MREARVFRALIRVQTETELFDATQSLKLARINQAHHQLAFVSICLQANDVVNWIAINAFLHGRFLITANQCEGNTSEYQRTASKPSLDMVGLRPQPVEISGFSHFFGFAAGLWLLQRAALTANT